MWQDEPRDARADASGWKVETVGDDIAWMRFGDDGRLYAINPEAGFFGVAPGTGLHTNANAIKTLEPGNSIFTNVALTDDGDVWWEGLTKEAPRTSSTGRVATGRPSQMSRARTRTRASRLPPGSARPSRMNGKTRQVSRSRRSCSVAAARRTSCSSTSRSTGITVFPRRDDRLGTDCCCRGNCCALRRDPFAMLPFRWLQHGVVLGSLAGISKGHDAGQAAEDLPSQLVPCDADGNFIWPGFGDNSRAFAWIIERLEGNEDARETAIGRMPTEGELNIDGLDITPEQLIGTVQR